MGKRRSVMVRSWSVDLISLHSVVPKDGFPLLVREPFEVDLHLCEELWIGSGSQQAWNVRSPQKLVGSHQLDRPSDPLPGAGKGIWFVVGLRGKRRQVEPNIGQLRQTDLLLPKPNQPLIPVHAEGRLAQVGDDDPQAGV